MAKGQWSQSQVSVALLAVLASIAVLWFLRTSYIVSMPLVFAFFLAVVVQPVQDWLDNRLPQKFHWVGTIAAMGTVLLALTIIVLLVYAIVATIVNAAPHYASKLSADWQQFVDWLEGHDVSVRRELVNAEKLVDLAAALVPVVWETFALLVLVFFFAMMMLLEAAQWSHKTDITLNHSVPVKSTVQELATRVRTYFQSVTVVSVISGTAHGLFQGLVGVDLWYIWGLLMFVMNYIPNIGSLLALIPPLLVTLVQYGPWYMLLVLVGMSIVETLVAYVIAPRLHGKTQALSPLVVIVSIVFWGWLWGIVGAFLAVPLTVTVIAFFERTPGLRSIAVLLAEEDDAEEKTSDSGKSKDHD